MISVLPFNDDNLANSLVNDYTTADVIKSKNHFAYFKYYLGKEGIDAKTIVIEDKYISKDYLHDYASYYSLCFEDYPKFCKRVHFFAADFDLTKFEAALLDFDPESSKEFWQHYLGFIVVKPIPVNVIGYTVLKTYEAGKDLEGRYFWGLKVYKVHLFGREIEVKSLAFQEQDRVLAACATTSIWSMLNKVIGDTLPTYRSPSQITNDADKMSQDGSRLFPNKGLNVLQICQAIIGSGLVSEVKQPDTKNGKIKQMALSESLLKQIIRAYSGLGIPIILVVQVPTVNGYRAHAITVLGFKQAFPPVGSEPGEIAWVADTIERIYAHDDQWGPFTRIKFLEDGGIETNWTEDHKQNDPTFVVSAVVSLFPKVRISYEDVKALVLGLEVILKILFEKSVNNRVSWDVRILYSEDFKKEIATSHLEHPEKLKILTSSMPRYVWVASCYVGRDRIFDFSFDATNVADAMIGLQAICYVTGLKSVVANFIKDNRARFVQAFTHKLAERYIEFLIEQLESPE